MTPAALLRDYQAGNTIRDLAWKYGVGRGRIITLLRTTGTYAPRRVAPRGPARREAAVAAGRGRR